MEESGNDAKEVAERQVAVGNQALHLIELGEVRGVQGLVAEHAVNREVLGRLELLLQRSRGARSRREAR